MGINLERDREAAPKEKQKNVPFNRVTSRVVITNGNIPFRINDSQIGTDLLC